MFFGRDLVLVNGPDLRESLLAEIGWLRLKAWGKKKNLPLGVTSNKPWTEPKLDCASNAWHCLLYVNGELVASSRMTFCRSQKDLPQHHFFDGVVDKIQFPVVSFNRLVIDPKHQGKGLSQVLRRARFKKAQELGAEYVVMWTPNAFERSVAEEKGYNLYQNIGEVEEYPNYEILILGGRISELRTPN